LEFYTDQLSNNNDVIKAPEEPRHHQNIPGKSMNGYSNKDYNNPVSIL